MRKKENYIKHSVLQKVYGKIGKKKSPRKGAFYVAKVAKKLQCYYKSKKIVTAYYKFY